ncbi:LuxR C-terminal-related transcriptional regulator [Shewanella sp. TC10]|uniref:LuxR C-terminal-related transcriptional regulator n=1 Tax=Shewanella sp. TC10 TaxID=1419739 RepID=UPI00129E7FD7|nr:LuxR C-terminal-related transcriptional regulator [Shewanella sp. TC10]
MILLDKLSCAMTEELGNRDIIYFIDTNNECPLEINKKKLGNKRTNMLSSSINVMNFAKVSRKKWAPVDENTPLSRIKQFHHWEYSNWSNKSKSPLTEMKKFGYESKITINVPCAFNPNFYGSFFMLFEDEVVLPQDYLFKLEKRLIEFQHEVIFKQQNLLNPIMDYQIISEPERKTIQLVASGASRGDIATECFLTNRGVDYRLAVIKKKLGVKTWSQMVFLAANLGLIQSN